MCEHNLGVKLVVNGVSDVFRSFLFILDAGMFLRALFSSIDEISRGQEVLLKELLEHLDVSQGEANSRYSMTQWEQVNQHHH